MPSLDPVVNKYACHLITAMTAEKTNARVI